MKKEADDAGVDFTVSIDEQGFLAEGPTENVGIITSDREFLVPRFDRILRGTTVSRALELAESLLEAGDLARMGETDLTPEDAYHAAEIMMFGTTYDVMPVVNYDGHRIGDGRPGRIPDRVQWQLDCRRRFRDGRWDESESYCILGRICLVVSPIGHGRYRRLYLC